MSTFEVNAVTIRIETHPNADAIEMAFVGDYVSIVKKGEFKTGDLAIYIPEAAIVPQNVLEKMGMWDAENDKGRLAGKLGNRVKAIRLRGQISQGLIYPLVFRTDVHDMDTHVVSDEWVLTYPRGECEAGHVIKEGDDVAESLGVVKWEPPIPTCMAGEVFAAFGKTLKFDIENIKRYPDVFEDGENVVVTEKLHGTWCCMGYHPEIDHAVITSKGLSEKGLAFKFNEANERNLYIKAFHALTENRQTILDRFADLNDVMELMFCDIDEPFYILGEIFGQGVQDLHYGITTPEFRVFDIYVGYPHNGHYLSQNMITQICVSLNLPMVPVLYTGEFSKEVVDEYTNGKETFSGKETHMREGIVIHPAEERREDALGRVILKSVSEAYLLRKGKKGESVTEFN